MPRLTRELEINMFGLPTEVTVGMISAVGGFVMKYMAQKNANNFELMKLGMERQRLHSELADAAAKRSSPWLRKFAAIVVLLVAFVGIYSVAWAPNVDVSMVEDVPQKSVLWGLIKWGKTTQVTTAEGFVIAEWFKYSVIVIIHFLFGTGAAKPVR